MQYHPLELSARQAFDLLLKSLCTIYDEREARSIGSMVFLDIFSLNVASQKLLSEENILLLQKITERLLKHEPVQYIIGFADFYGLKFKVSPDVLIPRPETEELVHWVIQTCKENHLSKPGILDIGTGSGCIAITLARKIPGASLRAWDISEQAISVAKENAEKNAVAVCFEAQDILSALSERTAVFDIMVSNPPYIPISERPLMGKNVLLHEPDAALFVNDDDPLIFYRKIAAIATTSLKNGGFLFFECNEHNASEVVHLLQTLSFSAVLLQKDLSGKDRMVRAQKSGSN